MSILLMTQVRTIVTTPTQQLVLLYLADCGSDDGTRIYPSQGRIAHETGLAISTVRAILKALESSRILEPVAYQRGGRGMATEYIMHLEAGTPKPPYTPRKKAPESSTFTEKAPESSTFTEKAPESSTFTEKAPESSENVLDHLQNVLSPGENVLKSSTQPLVNHYIEPLEEPLTRTREEIAPEDFDYAAQLWRMIRQHLQTQLSDAQRHWLGDVQLMPNLETPGYVLIAPNAFTRGIIEQRWRLPVELKAMSISGRRLPVAVMTAGEYQRQLMAAESGDELGEAAEA